MQLKFMFPINDLYVILFRLPVAATPRTLLPSIPDTPGREEPSSIAATPKGDMASKRASFVEV